MQGRHHVLPTISPNIAGHPAVACGAQTIWEVATRTAWSRPWPEIHGFMRRAALRWPVAGQAAPVSSDTQAR